ncbi:MAG: transglutaminase domain-containing protein [Candidatus Micrarchaeota archaeon]
MKSIILLLLLVSASYSSFGYSRIELERIWTIEAPEPGAHVTFEGMLVFNDSFQKVYLIHTEPEMDMMEDENGSIRLQYEGTMDGTVLRLKGSTLVELYYNTSLKEDPPLPEGELGYTELTMPNQAIRMQAQALKEDTALETIRNLANWVHQNVEYDLGYWGQTRTAEEIFSQRRGVCVQYSHLFISMARSLGLQTRYVSGYVNVNRAWQAHAWTEVYVPDYGWLPVDPTFGEVGTLDNSHLIIAYGTDQESIYDSLFSNKPDTLFSVDDSLSAKLDSEDPHGIQMLLSFQRELLTLEVTVRNTDDDYQFATYSYAAPEDYGGQVGEIILLKPNEERHFYYSLNNSLFQDGYTYRIPVRASANDAVAEEEIVINRPHQQETAAESVQEATSCLLPSLVFMLILFISSLAIFERKYR